MNAQQKIDAQVLELHRLIAAEIERRPDEAMAYARETLTRWRAVNGDHPCYREWASLLQQGPPTHSCIDSRSRRPRDAPSVGLALWRVPEGRARCHLLSTTSVTRAQVEHALRAAADLTGERDFFVVGSQSNHARPESAGRDLKPDLCNRAFAGRSPLINPPRGPDCLADTDRRRWMR